MQIQFEKIMIPIILASLTAVLLLITRSILFRIFHHWASKTESNLDNLVIRAMRIPSIFWCLAMGLYIGLNVSDYDGKYLYYISKSIHILLALSITMAAANLISKMFNYNIQRSNIPLPTTGLVNGILRGIIWVLGLIMILSFLGIPISPLITAIGVGGLAVALALQDTLANLFAGIHIMIEKTIRVGDFVKLETGQEGYVEDITWRTTRVRMLPNNMVLIPNHRLSQSIVTNYYLPEKKMSLLIPISVSYQTDPGKVEWVLLEVVRQAVGEVPGLLADPEPFVRFIPGFGESSLDFTLICQVREFVDQYLVQHELRKRIFKSFKEKHIEIPYPHRTVYLREEKEWEK